jgi:hypothetical protein
MTILTRRQALCLALLPLASIVSRITAAFPPVGEFTTENETLRCFRGLFVEPGAPRTIGHEYLHAFPRERSRAFLQRAITGGAPLHDTPQLRTLLVRKREHDFLIGDVAIVDGWILSRTEARACALLAVL